MRSTTKVYSISKIDTGAIGVDGVQLGQVASRGAGGLVNTGKKTNAKNNFATARNTSCVLA